MKQLLLPLTCLLVLISCSSNNKKKKDSPAAFKSTIMDTAYNKIRPALQHFTINTGKTNTIKAARGTEILIPAGCFTNADGETVKGEVKIEVVEAFSLNDFISSGLATVSNGKMLISNGMMYFNAKSGDEQLEIKKETPLTVSMPTKSDSGGFQMFTGDGSNWTVDSSMMKEEDYAITLPLDLLYPEGNRELYYCITSVGDKDEKYYLYDTSIMNLTEKKYENTVIATLEFKERIYPLSEMMRYMSFFVNRGYYYEQQCEKQEFNYDIVKIYFDHPQRSLEQSDSIARKMYTDYFKANKEKILRFCDSVNIYLRSYYSNWSDTDYYFDFRYHSLDEQYMTVFKYFPPAHTKEIKQFNNYGIDLNDSNAFDKLNEKGIGLEEINQLLTYNYKREKMIELLRRRKLAILDKKKIDNLYQSTVFSVTKMGWINCDRFYDDPSAAKAEIYVANSSSSILPYTDYSLVIPEMNVRLQAHEEKPGIYSFTKKDSMYMKLPVGKPAVIVGVSVQHDSVFFASQKIIIKDKLSVQLPMKYINSGSLKDSLLTALK